MNSIPSLAIKKIGFTAWPGKSAAHEAVTKFIGLVYFVPGGGLGDADQVFDGWVLPEAGVVNEDGFSVEEARFPGGLEGVGGDFDVGGLVGG